MQLMRLVRLINYKISDRHSARRLNRPCPILYKKNMCGPYASHSGPTHGLTELLACLAGAIDKHICNMKLLALNHPQPIVKPEGGANEQQLHMPTQLPNDSVVVTDIASPKQSTVKQTSSSVHHQAWHSRPRGNITSASARAACRHISLCKQVLHCQEDLLSMVRGLSGRLHHYHYDVLP